MPLKRCSECKGDVATNANTCPHCGHDFGMETAGNCVGMGCVVIAVLVVLILIIVAISEACS